MAGIEATSASEVAMGAAAMQATMDVAAGLAPTIAEPTLLDMIICDHRNIMTFFTHFDRAALQGRAHLMQMHAAAIVQEVRLHSQAEMAVLYPLLTSLAAGQSSPLATRGLEEHQVLEGELLTVLGSVGCSAGGAPNGLDLVANMTQLQAYLSAHIQDEEQAVLPHLVAAFSRDQLVLYGQQFMQTKQTATILPQPAVAGLGAAIAAGGGSAATAPISGALGASPGGTGAAAGAEGGGGVTKDAMMAEEAGGVEGGSTGGTGSAVPTSMGVAINEGEEGERDKGDSLKDDEGGGMEGGAAKGGGQLAGAATPSKAGAGERGAEQRYGMAAGVEVPTPMK